MLNFINNIGQDNIYIIIGIIIAIVIALVIIIIIENHSKKEFNKLDDFSYQKKRIKKKDNIEIENNDFDLEQKETFEIVEPTNDVSYYEEPISTEVNVKSTPKTAEEAQEAIKQAAQKMVYEGNKDEGPTYFEKIQEEQAIISYDELLDSDIDVDKENDLLIEDEGNEPITMDELYKLHKENSIEDEEPKKVTIPVINQEQLEEEPISQVPYHEHEPFKKSEIISPVFGVKRDIIYKKEYNEFGETINIEELEVEIKKTEEFLKELKKLKNKLE